MTRDPRYDILFEPIRIGPVTARNRFFQVPHCNGMGHPMPRAVAAMRGVKAEGGWAVVSTEECEIHPTSDVSPFAEARLWDDQDVPGLALMCEAVHRHGALAAIELTHNGISGPNRLSREVPIAPSARPVAALDPIQARAMDKADIKALRGWHRAAAIRARRAGFDIVYVYAAHELSIAQQFLSRRYNQRSDEYGGSLENRVRLLRELIEDAKEAVGDTCAVALRMAVDELIGEAGLTSEGEGRDIVAMLAELPDLWDVSVGVWANDSVTSRFGPEGGQEPYVAFVKKLTSKPVVGVGRFTSPDAMVAQVRRGVLDMIGAARPSIADPFLPRKIEEGRIDEIRECIGCNICVSGDYTVTPIRCTQNPTMGEEWRKGWHPERLPARLDDRRLLVVGGGPAGLEAARAAALRGHEVHLAEAGEEFGGRVARESRLPGLEAWARVRDYRIQQLGRMANVSLYRASRLALEDVLEFGADEVAVATGARWRGDGVGRFHPYPVPGFSSPGVLTPDDVMADARAVSPVVIFDDDHYYMGGVIAEKLRAAGHEVTLVTPASAASAWSVNTLELDKIQARLIERGVTIVANRAVTSFADGEVELACVFTRRRSTIPAACLVSVTARLPDAALADSLMAAPERLAAAGILKVSAIGDALAPGTIAAAVYGGHRFARELGQTVDGAAVAFRREVNEAFVLR